MKHQTPESMKFRKFQRSLGVSRVVAVGTLELLWIATQKNAPQGDIGRFSDLEIAIECEWEGDPSVLISALEDSGWIDACDVHRYVIHDWDEHCPGWVKRQLARHEKPILVAKNQKKNQNEGSFEDLKTTAVAVRELLTVTNDSLEPTNGTPAVTDDCLESTPNPRKPKETQGKEINNMSAESGLVSSFEYPRDFENFWLAFPKTRRTKKKDAFKKWKLAVKSTPMELLLSKAIEYGKSDQGKSQFAVMPSVWINSAMWEDDPASWSSKKQEDVPIDRVFVEGRDGHWNPTTGIE